MSHSLLQLTSSSVIASTSFPKSSEKRSLQLALKNNNGKSIVKPWEISTSRQSARMWRARRTRTPRERRRIWISTKMTKKSHPGSMSRLTRVTRRSQDVS
jgi:hypothetical protein